MQNESDAFWAKQPTIIARQRRKATSYGAGFCAGIVASLAAFIAGFVLASCLQLL